MTHFISKEDYLTVKKTWASKQNHSAKDHVLYNVLRGKDAKLGFSEKTKHIQGNDSWYGYKSSLKNAMYSVDLDVRFGGPERILDKHTQFKEVFGIPIPANLRDKLMEFQS